MRKRIGLGLLLGLALSASAAVWPARSDVRVNASVSSGPARIYFETAPEYVIIPGTRVYYYDAPEYDVFRYRNTVYVNRYGTWYRATSYRGPFVQISRPNVPRAIVRVPAKYHRHAVKVKAR